MDTDHLMDFLASEGFRATLVAPGEVHIKIDGGLYIIWFPPPDDQYVAVSFPGFWKISSPEEGARALRAANEASIGTKVVKVFVAPEGRVSAEAQMYVSAPEQIEAVFLRCVDTLKYAVSRFVDVMRKPESPPDERIALKREEVTRFLREN